MSHLLKKSPTPAQLEKCSEDLATVSRLFRRAGGCVAKQYSPTTLSNLFKEFGFDTLKCILSDADSPAELKFVTDTKLDVGQWRFDALQDQIQRFGLHAVWSVLASREYGVEQISKGEPLLETLLNTFAEVKPGEFDNKESSIRKSLQEQRKKLIAAISQ